MFQSFKDRFAAAVNSKPTINEIKDRAEQDSFSDDEHEESNEFLGPASSKFIQIHDDLEENIPQLKILREAFEYAVAVEQIASTLILNNPRFIDLSDRLATDHQENLLAEFVDWHNTYSSIVATDFVLDKDYTPLAEKLFALGQLNDAVMNYSVNSKENSGFFFTRSLR